MKTHNSKYYGNFTWCIVVPVESDIVMYEIHGSVANRHEAIQRITQCCMGEKADNVTYLYPKVGQLIATVTIKWVYAQPYIGNSIYVKLKNNV